MCEVGKIFETKKKNKRKFSDNWRRASSCVSQMAGAVCQAVLLNEHRAWGEGDSVTMLPKRHHCAVPLTYFPHLITPYENYERKSFPYFQWSKLSFGD